MKWRNPVSSVIGWSGIYLCWLLSLVQMHRGALFFFLVYSFDVCCCGVVSGDDDWPEKRGKKALFFHLGRLQEEQRFGPHMMMDIIS